MRDDIADRFGPDVLVEYVVEQMKEARTANKPFFIVHNELMPHDPIIDTPEDREPGPRCCAVHFLAHPEMAVPPSIGA